MLELEIIKQQCRIEQDETEEDALLDTYATAARRLVENKTGRNIYATPEEIPKDVDGNAIDDRALVLDDDITTAMLLVIGHWYANRESVVVGTITSELPMAVNAIIAPYQFYNV